MDDLIKGLLVVLGSEEDLYRRMRELLDEESAVLERLDAEAFAAIVRHKEELADEGRLLEQTRIAVARELATALDLAAEPRLAAICQALGPKGAALAASHKRLVVRVGVVRELLETNANVARESLGHVRATLSLLGGLAPEDSSRDDPGRVVTRPGQLLRQAV